MAHSVMVWDPDQLCRLVKVCHGVDLFDQAEITPDLDQVRNSTHKVKVAMVQWFLYRTGSTVTDPDLSWADVVVCYSSELIHEPWYKFVPKSQEYFNNPNCVFVYGGTVTGQMESNPRIFVPNLQFFSWVVQANPGPEYRTELDRPWRFDVLLGRSKRYRRELFVQLQRRNLVPACLINLEGEDQAPGHPPSYRSSELDQLERAEIVELRQHCADQAQAYSSSLAVTQHYPGYAWNKIWASQLMPWQVYAHAWYSIVSETQTQGHLFFTEKTAKPLLARRVFVCYSSQGHLAALRKEGFETFGSIIDESYDQEPDPDLRLRMMMHEVEWLAQSDPWDVYRRARPILEHNYQRIKDMSWKSRDLAGFLQQHVNQTQPTNL